MMVQDDVFFNAHVYGAHGARAYLPALPNPLPAHHKVQESLTQLIRPICTSNMKILCTSYIYIQYAHPLLCRHAHPTYS